MGTTTQGGESKEDDHGQGKKDNEEQTEDEKNTDEQDEKEDEQEEQGSENKVASGDIQDETNETVEANNAETGRMSKLKTALKLSPQALLASLMLIVIIGLIVFVVWLIINAPSFIYFLLKRYSLGNGDVVAQYETDFYDELTHTMDVLWQTLIQLGEFNYTHAIKYITNETPSSYRDNVRNQLKEIRDHVSKYRRCVVALADFANIVAKEYKSGGWMVQLVDHALQSAAMDGIVHDRVLEGPLTALGIKVPNVLVGNPPLPLASNIMVVLKFCMQYEAQMYVSLNGFKCTELSDVIFGVENYEQINDKYVNAMRLKDAAKLSNGKPSVTLLPTNTFYSAHAHGTKVALNDGLVSQVLGAFHSVAHKQPLSAKANFISAVAPKFYTEKRSDPKDMGISGELIESVVGMNIKYLTKEAFINEKVKPNVFTHLQGHVLEYQTKEGQKTPMEKAVTDFMLALSTPEKWESLIITHAPNMPKDKWSTMKSDMRLYSELVRSYEEVIQALTAAIILKDKATHCDLTMLVTGTSMIYVNERILSMMMGYEPPELLKVYAPTNLIDWWVHEFVLFIGNFGHNTGLYFASMGYLIGQITTDVPRISNAVNAYFTNWRHFMPKEVGGSGFFGKSISEFVKNYNGGNRERFQDRPNVEDDVEPFLGGLVKMLKNIVKVFVGIGQIIVALIKLMNLLVNKPATFLMGIVGVLLFILLSIVIVILHATFILYGVVFVWHVIMVVLSTVLVLAIMLVSYLLFLVLGAIFASFDITLYFITNGHVNLMTTYRRTFTCIQHIPNQWFSTQYTHVGNKYIPIMAGPMCFGCLSPCPSGYKPKAGASGSIQCVRTKDTPDAYTPGSMIMSRLMTGGSPSLLRNNIAPANNNEFADRMEMFRAICRYAGHVNTDEMLKLNCKSLFCSGVSSETDCSCAQQLPYASTGTVAAALDAVNETIGWPGAFAALMTLMTCCAVAYVYVKKVQGKTKSSALKT